MGIVYPVNPHLALDVVDQIDDCVGFHKGRKGRIIRLGMKFGSRGEKV